jgi:succinate dehydrogenase/fumarate reductase flavoprotein subunit
MDDLIDGLSEVSCDVLVIGGGTAGPMAALKAKRKNPDATVILLEKANVKRSGAISMGMDGLNNAVIPGYATPEQYTKEITIANDGIVDQKPVYKYAQRLLLDHRGARQLRHPLSQERERRLRGQEGPPHRHLCAADAEWRDRSRKALYRSCGARGS